MTNKFVVPTLVDAPDELTFNDGTLFKLPPDLGGTAKIKSYAEKTTPGWHKIDFGHWMYIHKSEELGFVRFIGILPAGSRTQRGVGSTHPFSKADFEKYVENLVESEQKRRDQIQDEISLLIHDLRRFSNSIYQAAVATKKAIFDGNGNEALLKIENTLAAQAMLRIRTDILDLAESKETQADEERVPVYRKFDKVVKSFQPGSILKKVDLKIIGASHSLVIGPDCVEIIAYILVDNALKYSPANHSITVNVLERQQEIEIEVTSLGPIIEKDEIEAIFEKGVRSRAAQQIEASGTGYGLYLAKSLALRFKASITVEQSGTEIVTLRGKYVDTTFRLIFPIHEKLERPVHFHVEKKEPAKELASPERTGKKPAARSPSQSASRSKTQSDSHSKSATRNTSTSETIKKAENQSANPAQNKDRIGRYFGRKRRKKDRGSADSRQSPSKTQY